MHPLLRAYQWLFTAGRMHQRSRRLVQSACDQLTAPRQLNNFRRLEKGALRMVQVLDRQVLVLNRLWQAINVCSVRRAFALLCAGHAQVVYSDGENFLTHDFPSWRDFSREAPENDE